MNKFQKLNTEEISILDEMSKIHIEQLHNTTLNISKQSFEIKKLCIVTLAGVLTLSLKKEIKDIIWLPYLLLIITFFFFIIDSFTYGYQRNLRNKMIEEENKIYQRNNINLLRNTLNKKNQFFNVSNTLYFILLIIFLGAIII